MPIEQDEYGNITVTGKSSIQLVHWITIKHAIRLEMAGLRHSRGSVSAHAAGMLGLPRRTRKEKVLAAVEAKIEEMRRT